MRSPSPLDRGTQQTVQIVSQLARCRGPGCRIGADHDVGLIRQRWQQGSHPMPQHPLGAIADNGVADGFGDHQADPLGLDLGGRHCHDQSRTCCPARTTTAQHCGEIRTVTQSMVRRQHCCPADAEPKSSGRDLGAALGAARRQDRAARTGAHPQTETVHLGTLTGVGLEGTLAHCRLRRDVRTQGGPDRASVIWGLRRDRRCLADHLPEGTVLVQAGVSEEGSRSRYGPLLHRVKPSTTDAIECPNHSANAAAVRSASRHAEHGEKSWLSGLPGRRPSC